MVRDGVVAGSFRDPSGVVFRKAGVIYRQINGAALADLERLESSGLYQRLVEAGLLVAHEDVEVEPPDPTNARRVIRPDPVPFISYPYEWCFGQLKDAALATLDVQLAALEHDMSLKDASAFNIQFVGGRPTLIDTLSFEAYEEGRPWVAYRQFCEHFLAPLMLVAYVDPWLGRLSALTADGVPLGTASRLLPWSSRLRPSALLHIHLHARSVSHFGGRSVPGRLKSRGLDETAMRNLVEGLRHAVERLDWSPTGTEWADYAQDHGYASESMESKRRVVDALLASIAPRVVWDMGANTGDFSRMAHRHGAFVVAIDIDPAAVEQNYRRMLSEGSERLHPLWIDLRSPSPDLGWAQEERGGLRSRATADVVLALALVHHLAIGANVPLPRISEWLSGLGRHVIVEFVPKADPQVKRLLVSREDVFLDYSRSTFEEALGSRFRLAGVHELPGSGRVLYHGIRHDD